MRLADARGEQLGHGIPASLHRSASSSAAPAGLGRVSVIVGPTTSVAPPPLVPGLAWPLVRTGLGGGALVLRGLAAANAGATARGAISVVGVTALVVVAVAALPLLLPRYRSFRAFSWLFLIACLCALQLSRDPIVHFAALKGAFLVDCESVS